MKPLQHPEELQRFVQLLRDEGVRSYLEIGSKFGGSLRAVTLAMPKGSRAVAVDLPRGTKDWGTTGPSLTRCVEELRKQRYDMHLIWGNSTDLVVVEKVRALGPFDALLIDANHTYPYVQQDWRHYGPMARIVAFHDIAWKRPADWKGGYRIDVPQFWDNLAWEYRHEEIRLDPTGQDNGIGILWRETKDAEQEQGASADDAGGGAQQRLRQEDGNSPVGGEGFREGR